MKCNECKRNVSNTFEGKFKHMFKYHPWIPIRNIADIVFNPERAQLAGEFFGRYVKTKIERGNR